MTRLARFRCTPSGPFVNKLSPWYIVKFSGIDMPAGKKVSALIMLWFSIFLKKICFGPFTIYNLIRDLYFLKKGSW
jgi:hypothetical protein